MDKQITDTPICIHAANWTPGCGVSPFDVLLCGGKEGAQDSWRTLGEVRAAINRGEEVITLFNSMFRTATPCAACMELLPVALLGG